MMKMGIVFSNIYMKLNFHYVLTLSFLVVVKVLDQESWEHWESTESNLTSKVQDLREETSKINLKSCCGLNGHCLQTTN